jgi:2-C-methyl-D-erythritol 4-phosphate cytidylyltransferase
VIVAAGTANRMGGTDKILAELDGQTVIARAVEAFQNSALIDEIVVVTRQEDLEQVSEARQTVFQGARRDAGRGHEDQVRHGGSRRGLSRHRARRRPRRGQAARLP